MDKIMEEKSYQLLKATHPKTNSSHLKMMVGIRSFPFRAKGPFSGAVAVSFREGINKNLLTAPQEPVVRAVSLVVLYMRCLTPVKPYVHQPPVVMGLDQDLLASGSLYCIVKALLCLQSPKKNRYQHTTNTHLTRWISEKQTNIMTWQMNNEKNCGCLGYVGDYATQLCGDYCTIIRTLLRKLVW